MEVYLIPYTPNHRYWTGLLLLVRVSVYTLLAFNHSGGARLTLLMTNFIMTSLVIYIATFGIRMYKNHFINTMETLTYFNIIVLTIFTWYTVDANTNQTAITNISVGITFIQLTAVILYHAYKYMNQKLFTMIHESFFSEKIKRKLIKTNNNDYVVSQIQLKAVTEPTQSVVEISESIEAPGTLPPLLEAIEEESEIDQERTDVIPVAEENPPIEIVEKNKQCITNDSGIEVLECGNTSTGNDLKYNHNILKENSIPKPHSNCQVNNNSDVKYDKEEAVNTTKSGVVFQSSGNGHQKGIGSDI